MYFLLAIIVWLSINFFTGWLEFNSLICIFAWTFLIMPFLLQFKISELFNFKIIKKYIWKSLLINYIINILIFGIVWYIFFGLDKILIWFILLSILSWWWLLLSWINKSWGSTKLWFQLFMINFIIFNIIFIPLSLFIENNFWNNIENNYIPQQNININDYNIWIDNNYLNNTWLSINKEKEWWACVISEVTWNKFTCFTPNGWVSPIVALFVLIIFPFIISRILLLSKKVSNLITKYIKQISSIATFLLIWYIFTLKDLHSLLYSDLTMVMSIWFATLIIYFVIFCISYNIYLKSNKKEEDKTIFWIWTTRFITLWLIFSFVYSFYIWSEIMLIFIFAYFIQIIFSIIFLKKIKKN